MDLSQLDLSDSVVLELLKDNFLFNSMNLYLSGYQMPYRVDFYKHGFLTKEKAKEFFNRLADYLDKLITKKLKKNKTLYTGFYFEDTKPKGMFLNRFTFWSPFISPVNVDSDVKLARCVLPKNSKVLKFENLFLLPRNIELKITKFDKLIDLFLVTEISEELIPTTEFEEYLELDKTCKQVYGFKIPDLRFDYSVSDLYLIKKNTQHGLKSTENYFIYESIINDSPESNYFNLIMEIENSNKISIHYNKFGQKYYYIE